LAFGWNTRGKSRCFPTRIAGIPAEIGTKRVQNTSLLLLLLLMALQPFCWALAVLIVPWSYTQSIGLLGRGISSSQGRYLHTGQHKHRMNTHIHPYLHAGIDRAKSVHAFYRTDTAIHQMAWVRERTIPAVLPALFGEVSAYFCG
jgi:hypothetical protein